MPSIPIIDSPSVAPQPLPGVRQQVPSRLLLAASIGPEQQVRLGNAMQNFGNGVHQAAAAEADANLIGAIQGVLYGTPDNPNSGYLNQKGKNAVDTYQDTVKALQNLAPEQAKNLSGAASGLAQTSTNLRVQSAIAQITQHNSQQTGVYQQAAGQTRIKAAADSAAVSYNPIFDAPGVSHPVLPNGGPDVADLQVNPTTTDTTKWGKRPDGSAKGNGFLGLLKRPDGSISSELSISTDAVGGKDFPLLVPTLTKDEVKKVLAIKEGDPKFFDKLPPGVVQKAEAYAKQREAQGKPLFAGKDEEPHFGANAPDNAASLSPYQLNLRTIQAEANSLADLQGIRDPDLRNAFIKDQMSTAYVGALAHMVEGGKNLNGEKLKVAQNYFDSIKDNLSAKQQDTIQSVLKAGALQDTVLSYSDKLMDSHKGERAQLQQIRADFEAGRISGQEREHIESRINHLNAQAREQDGQHTASIVGQAQDFFIKNPGATITDLPTPLYAQLMNKGQLASIDGFSKREANHTDPATLQRVQTHFNDGSPDDIMKMSDTDFLNLHGRLSNTDWKYWGTQRDNAKKGLFSPRTDAGSVQEGVFNTSLKTRLSAIGIDVKSMKGEEDRARLGGLQQFAKEWIIADQTAAGHKFNDEQLGRSLDRLMATNAEFRTTFIGFDTGSGAMPLMKMGYGDLPSDAREGIKKALIKNGNPNPTKQDILNAYWRIHGTR